MCVCVIVCVYASVKFECVHPPPSFFNPLWIDSGTEERRAPTSGWGRSRRPSEDCDRFFSCFCWSADDRRDELLGWGRKLSGCSIVWCDRVFAHRVIIVRWMLSSHERQSCPPKAERVEKTKLRWQAKISTLYLNCVRVQNQAVLLAFEQEALPCPALPEKGKKEMRRRRIRNQWEREERPVAIGALPLRCSLEGLYTLRILVHTRHTGTRAHGHTDTRTHGHTEMFTNICRTHIHHITQHKQKTLRHFFNIPQRNRSVCKIVTIKG